MLSTGGNYTQSQDIAVAYRRTSDNESMVATFRNLQGGFNFQRQSPVGQSGDYDAGQTFPTAIAVGNVSAGTWNDIIVANNDGRGTISVLPARGQAARGRRAKRDHVHR